MNPSSMLRDVK